MVDKPQISPIRLKKNIAQGRYDEASNKEKPEYIALSYDQWKGLGKYIQHLEEALDKALEDVDYAVEEAQTYRSVIAKAKDRTHQMLARHELSKLSEQKITEKLTLVDEALDVITKQHANLLRIHKERSNADRKLKPKKKHPGYVVKRSKEVLTKIDDERVFAWQTVIQTPYDARLPVKDADSYIKKDYENGILSKMGIGEFNLNNSEYMLEKNFLSNYYEIHVITKQEYKPPTQQEQEETDNDGT